MPEPLDYRNAKASPPAAEVTEPPEPPRPVIPIEFEILVTRTQDHAAALAIQAALKRETISFHVSHDGALKARSIEIYVKPDDRDRSLKIADVIIARREKLKSFPRQQPLPEDPIDLRSLGFPESLL